MQKGGADPEAYPAVRYLTGYGLSSPGGSGAQPRSQALAMAREGLEESLLVRAVLGGAATPVSCPPGADIDRELRRALAARKGLDGLVATAALDLGGGLPRGIRVLMDRITYADTPFCGSLSAYLEQALGAELVACGQVKVMASTAPLDPPAAAPQGLQAVRADLASIVGHARGITLRKAEAPYAEDTAVVNTLPGGKP